MAKKIKFLVLTGFVTVLLGIAAACSSDSSSSPGAPGTTPSPNPTTAPNTGPIDGKWNLTELDCNNQSVDLGGNTIQVKIQGGSFQTTTSVLGCSITSTESATYTSSGEVDVTGTGNVSCSPSACDPVCTEGPTVRTEKLSYNRSGTLLVLQSIPGTDTGFCPSGQQVTLNLESIS